jgi:hypothetical protein
VWLNDPTRRKSSRIRRTDFTQQWTNADRWILLSTPSSLE